MHRARSKLSISQNRNSITCADVGIARYSIGMGGGAIGICAMTADAAVSNTLQ